MLDKADVLPRTSVKLLATICDSDLGISATNGTVSSAQFESRLAARVVIVSPHTEIALLDVKKFH